jgi:methanogenic corrinoid protein MtbC1
MRTDTNIRFYDLQSLQKLLNITLLHNHGYKISKISKYPPERIPMLVREIVTEKSVKHHAINAFKMAMINFDQTLFATTYNTLLSEKSFSEIFHDVFIPLLNEIGLLWQTNTISPSHEHFMTHLIKQKLLVNTEKIQINAPTNTEKIFVLFLPTNEIHELGLMYLNYEILLNGYKSIYLGENVPIEDLKDVKKYFDHITFVSYWTVHPEKSNLKEYISKINQEVLKDTTTELWLLGKMVNDIEIDQLSPNTVLVHSINEFVKKL